MARILIKGGRIVTAVDDYFADVLVEGERVVQIGKDLGTQADKIIDAKGKLVIPGGIDPHTHLDMPFGGTTSADDFESGTIAAAHGGTTTLIDFAIQTKGESTIKGLDTWHKKAAGKATIDYAFHMIVTDMPEERLPEMRKLADEGITSYKLFMAYPGVLYVDDGTLYRAFRQAGENSTRICMHAENGIVIDEIIRAAVKDGKVAPRWHAHTRPTRMEAEGVHRAIAIAEVAKVPLYIVHLSSSDALAEVKAGRARGVNVIAETCPQYLFLDDSYYDKPGFEGAKWVMTPALREKWNQEELWQGLQFRDLETIATDHCPFCFKEQKELGKDSFTKIPNGAPGVENRMSLVYNGGVVGGRISLNRFVELTSTRRPRPSVSSRARAPSRWAPMRTSLCSTPTARKPSA
jgi:dihydropyrimidinase